MSGILLLVTACTTSSSGPASEPPASLPIPSELPISSNEKATWTFTPNSQVGSYSSMLTTIIYQTDSPTIRQDSLITKITFTIGQTRTSDGISWKGMITEFSIEPLLTDSSIQSLHFPLSFTGSSKNHQLRFDLNEQTRQDPLTSCELSKIPLSAIQRISFVLPLQLTTGQTWQDSTSSTLCAGSIPSTITLIRTYHVLGITDLQGGRALTITENERALSKGEGSEGQHRIILEGSATTTRQFNVDILSENLISSKATTTTFLAIQVSGKTQRFTQLISETTTGSN